MRSLNFLQAGYTLGFLAQGSELQRPLFDT